MVGNKVHFNIFFNYDRKLQLFFLNKASCINTILSEHNKTFHERLFEKTLRNISSIGTHDLYTIMSINYELHHR